jgi:Sec-independent protein translocase protein TatA
MLLSEIFGPDLLVVIIAGAVLLFGGAAIPKFARNLGQSKSEFEKGMKSVKDLTESVKSGPPSSPSDKTE